MLSIISVPKQMLHGMCRYANLKMCNLWELRYSCGLFMEYFGFVQISCLLCLGESDIDTAKLTAWTVG